MALTKGSILLEQPITVASFITAMESIGFTNDSTAQTSTACTLTWDKDTDKTYRITMTIPASGNMSGGAYDNTYTNTTMIGNIMNGNASVTLNAYIDYLKFGDSILIGIRTSTTTEGYKIGLIAPVGDNDYWYVPNQNGLYTYIPRTTRAIPAKASPSLLPNMTASLPQSAVEVCKIYDDQGFVDNILMAPIHPSIPLNQTAKAQIGNKTYLIWSPVSLNYDYFAFDITSEVSQ